MCEGVWKESPDREVRRQFLFMPGKSHQFRSILVIHQGALGDFILALPALETLRKAYPQAELEIIGYPGILQLVDQRFYAGRILSIEQRGLSSFFVRGGPLDPSVSRLFGRFDLIALFGKDEEGTFVGNLQRVCRGPILHIRSFPTWGERIHLTDHLLRQFAQHGFPISVSHPRLHLKESDQDWGRKFWRSKGLTTEERSEAFVLHPGSGSRKKVWPLERFLILAKILQDRFNSKILIVLGPAEETETERVFEGMAPHSLIQAKGLSLLQLASVIKGCRVFIGNDSGISHLASALEVPTVVLFGPTDPEVWSPRGGKVQVISRNILCSPCPRETFLRCSQSECLKGIEIEEVLKGVEELEVMMT